MVTIQIDPDKTAAAGHCGPAPGRKIDWMLTVTAGIIIISYCFHMATATGPGWPGVSQFAGSIFTLINTMAWGILLAIIFTGLLGVIPREFVTSVLGQGGTVRGVARAMLAGVLLDLCSHGILIVGTRLYERGASLGQVMAFLIASPWNSLSLTLILWALVGFKWMLTFLLCSMAIAFVAGVIFDRLVARGRLPGNVNQHELPEDFRFIAEAKKQLATVKITPQVVGRVLWNGVKGSRMVMRWMFFGVVLAAGIRALVAPETFQSYFGPTIAGLGMTLIAATVIEVCSEGSVPIAADLLVRAQAPGNSFAFLMTGVSTDYTEIMVLKDVTASWKIALFLPLITVPQVIVLAWLMNQV
jgi:uncharacterized membrane protein YraQ (UPF0718 family)